MQLPSFSLKLVQPNATVAALTKDVLLEAGVDIVEDERQADLLLFDVSAKEDQDGRALLRHYESQGLPVLFCGLKPHRAKIPEGEERWLERPFSSGALLFHCANVMNVDWDPFLEELRASAEMNAPEHIVHEAALLEEEFDLEPGVLGGAMTSNASMSLEMYELESLDGVLVEESGVPDDSSLLEEGLVMGGVIQRGGIHSEQLDPSEVLNVHGFAQELTLSPPATSMPTHRSLPSIRKQGPSQEDETLTLEKMPRGQLEQEESYAELPSLDQEASLELRGFARMLAQAWNAVGIAAREEDRFDRINRIIHALFEQGLDAAALEIQRLPTDEGFFGSIRTFSMVGLFRTVRERQLRGRLELSISPKESYALYLEGQYLVQVESLQGDEDDLLLDVLVAQGVVEPEVGARLGKEGAVDDPFGEPLVMKLRQRYGLTKEVLDAARRGVAKRLFKMACQARTGHFSFIEIRQGTATTWPSVSLGISVDELLIQVLRESSIDTGVSEATSRTRLVPDAAQLLRLKRNVLTEQEKDLLAFFESGATLGRARAHFDHVAGGEVDKVVNRLKRAQLLQRMQVSRTESGMAITRDSIVIPKPQELGTEQSSDVNNEATRVQTEPPSFLMPEPPQPPQAPPALEPVPQDEERTVITDVNDSMIQDSFEIPEQVSGGELFATARGPGPFVLNDDVPPEAFEQPTKASSGHLILPPWVGEEAAKEEQEDIQRMLDELSSTLDDEP